LTAISKEEASTQTSSSTRFHTGLRGQVIILVCEHLSTPCVTGNKYFRLAQWMKIDHRTSALLRRTILAPTLIRHENEAFRKRSSNRMNFTTPPLVFSVDEKHFEINEIMTIIAHHDFPGRVFLNRNSKVR